ncbi:MAG: hypothetical protein ACTHK8_18825 [Ginsengibacter sp.]
MKLSSRIEALKLRRNDVWTFISISLSLAALIYTCHTNTDQNRKWDQLNLGKITIGSIKFENFREVTKVQFDTINWGYRVETVTGPDSRVLVDGKFYLQNCLIAYNPKTEVIYGTGSSTTLWELMHELKRLNIKDTAGLIIEKRYYLVIQMYNAGSTVCHVTNQTISSKDSSAPFGFKATSISDQPIDLEGNQFTHTIVPIYTYLNDVLPDTMDLTLSFRYKDVNNNKHRQAFHLKYVKPNWQVLAARERVD